VTRGERVLSIIVRLGVVILFITASFWFGGRFLLDRRSKQLDTPSRLGRLVSMLSPSHHLGCLGPNKERVGCVQAPDLGVVVGPKWFASLRRVRHRYVTQIE
jgi:hypothetical protein